MRNWEEIWRILETWCDEFIKKQKCEGIDEVGCIDLMSL